MANRAASPLLSSDIDDGIDCSTPPRVVGYGRFLQYNNVDFRPRRNRRPHHEDAPHHSRNPPPDEPPHNRDDVLDLDNPQENQSSDVEPAANVEALNYDVIENTVYYGEEKNLTTLEWNTRRYLRWILNMVIGALTGLVAVAINISIIQVTKMKMEAIGSAIHKCVPDQCLALPLLMWIGINALFVLVAALLTVYLSPVAAGSGIPQIKCFLNGIKIPHVVRFKTLATKVVGIIAAVSGGLAVGKEGPMIHSGAVIAAGVSQGRSYTFRHRTVPSIDACRYFRNDHEKRDFVCAGAAAGVAAAFGAPVGGVLFSLEEAASFWNQALTWRIFVCSILSSFLLNVCMSAYNGYLWDLSYPGLINFGEFNSTYQGAEMLIFFVMGAVGGAFGALFNAINITITKFRATYMNGHRRFQVMEAVSVAVISATVAFIAMYLCGDCRPLGTDPNVTLQFMCEDGQYNTMATLFFTPPEESVKSLFHDPLGAYSPTTVVAFVILYFFLACVTYGLMVPSGLFIPSLLIGAAWGRLFGMFINHLFPDYAFSKDMSKYALIGAAAQLGGTVRMTISLTVILIEATGNITFSFPLMMVLLIAKLVGDIFNRGIYDMHIEFGRIPILEWEPPRRSTHIHARQVMSSPAVCLDQFALVRHITHTLTDPTRNHSAYPVIGADGKFTGLILRSQILVMLKNKLYKERVERGERHPLQMSDFRDCYPREPQLSYINVSEDENNCHLELGPYMNPAPYTIYERASLPRIFRLFRGLGLRHLVVLNNKFRVVGIVTRKDLWKWSQRD